MLGVPWNKFLNLCCQPEAPSLSWPPSESSVSFPCDHWAGLHGRKAFVGWQFSMGLLHFFMFHEQEGMTPCFVVLSSPGWLFSEQLWKKKECLPLEQRTDYFLSSILKITSLYREQRLGKFACSLLQGMGVLYIRCSFCPVAHWVSCITWPLLRGLIGSEP